MFQFPAFASCSAWCRNRLRRVSPFGHLRVISYLPITAAFRSLWRPSSPLRATGIPHAPLFAYLFSRSLLFYLRFWTLLVFLLEFFFSFFTLDIFDNIFSICFFQYVNVLLFILWRITDSNRWPSACKADALASWANPPCLRSLIFRPRTISLRYKSYSLAQVLKDSWISFLAIIYLIPLLFVIQDCLILVEPAPERRCSSRTFRYGYLVTT